MSLAGLQVCRFVFSRSDQKYAIFPLDGTE